MRKWRWWKERRGSGKRPLALIFSSFWPEHHLIHCIHVITFYNNQVVSTKYHSFDSHPLEYTHTFIYELNNFFILTFKYKLKKNILQWFLFQMSKGYCQNMQGKLAIVKFKMLCNFNFHLSDVFSPNHIDWNKNKVRME